MVNGPGFQYDRIRHLWLVEVATGVTSRLTDGPVSDLEPAWSPDGTAVAFVSERRRDHDLAFRPAIHVVDVSSGAVRAVTALGPGRSSGHRCGCPTAPRSPRSARSLRARRQPERHLAVPSRRVGGARGGWSEPVGTPRPHAGFGRSQRHRAWRDGAGDPFERRGQPRFPRTDRRQLRTVADRRR